MATRRSYHSPLREEQARRTRAQILDALVELVCDQGPAVSMRELANRAGVAERTVYRHFADRAALLDGLTEHVGETSGWFDLRRDELDVDDLPATVARSFAIYDEHANAVRAMAVLNADPARAAGLSQANTAGIRRILAAMHPELDDGEVREVAAVLHLLASSRTWVRYRFEEGLDPEQAQRAAGRSVAAVLADLDGRRAGGGASGRGRRTRTPRPSGTTAARSSARKG